VDIDALVAAVAPARPFAVWIADACSSAHVDVRRATTATAVISASPIRLSTNATGRTYIADTLSRLTLVAADTDCDGALTDLELFGWLDEELPRRTGTSPQPKLRRQARAAEFVLLRAEPSAKCERIEAGEHAEANEQRAGAVREIFHRRHPRHVRMTGCVSRGSEGVLWDDHRVPHDRLIPMACTAGVGQCFRLRER
jgi:hypothetical protein